MNKPIKRTKAQPKKVVAKGEEHLIAQAEALAAQGANAFGDPNARFNVADDIKAMNNMGIPTQDTVTPSVDYEAIAQQEMDAYQEASLEEAMNVAKEKQKIIDPEASTKEEQSEFQLSEDPIERLGQIAEIFRKTDKNFPSKEVLIKLKRTYGNIFLLDLDDMVFIYRYMNRREVVQMELDESFQKLREDLKQDTIFAKCVLYPKFDPTRMSLLPGGIISTIVDTIQIKSMFLDPRQLAMATIKL